MKSTDEKEHWEQMNMRSMAKTPDDLFKALSDRPFLVKRIVKFRKEYNPHFGNDRLCQCGHPYYRHFDTYENMRNVGCKYCGCGAFQVAP